MIRAFFLQPPPLHNTSRVLLWRFLHTAMESSNHHATTRKFCCLTMPLKSSFIPLAVSSTVSRLHPVGAVLAEACESSDVLSESNNHPNSHYTEARGEAVGVSCRISEPAVTCSMKELKEIQRRQKIGLANKGKVPWNKGRKHSPETCARIKERTVEALKDPKVRKKMSETPHMHSELSKRKIGSSLKKLWAERLKQKRSKELFYSSWAESIAEAARRGGIGEQQLDWDSYERLKVEIAFQRLQEEKKAREKAKEKKLKRIEAEKKVQERERKQKAEVRERKQKAELRERKRKAELRTKKKERSYKGRKKKEDPAASGESNITDRCTKILGKKALDGALSTGVMIHLQSALEKFDIESIKAEQKRNTVSLADQIQAAKNKRKSVSSKSTSTTVQLQR